MSIKLSRVIVESVLDYGRSSDGRRDLRKVIFHDPISANKYVYFQRVGEFGIGSVDFEVGQHYEGLVLYMKPNAAVQIDSEASKPELLQAYNFRAVINDVHVFVESTTKWILLIYKDRPVTGHYQVDRMIDGEIASIGVLSIQQMFDTYGVVFE